MSSNAARMAVLNALRNSPTDAVVVYEHSVTIVDESETIVQIGGYASAQDGAIAAAAKSGACHGAVVVCDVEIATQPVRRGRSLAVASLTISVRRDYTEFAVLAGIADAGVSGSIVGDLQAVLGRGSTTLSSFVLTAREAKVTVRTSTGGDAALAVLIAQSASIAGNVAAWTGLSPSKVHVSAPIAMYPPCLPPSLPPSPSPSPSSPPRAPPDVAPSILGALLAIILVPACVLALLLRVCFVAWLRVRRRAELKLQLKQPAAFADVLSSSGRSGSRIPTQIDPLSPSNRARALRIATVGAAFGEEALPQGPQSLQSPLGEQLTPTRSRPSVDEDDAIFGTPIIFSPSAEESALANSVGVKGGLREDEANGDAETAAAGSRPSTRDGARPRLEVLSTPLWLGAPATSRDASVRGNLVMPSRLDFAGASALGAFGEAGELFPEAETIQTRIPLRRGSATGASSAAGTSADDSTEAGALKGRGFNALIAEIQRMRAARGAAAGDANVQRMRDFIGAARPGGAETTLSERTPMGKSRAPPKKEDDEAMERLRKKMSELKSISDLQRADNAPSLPNSKPPNKPPSLGGSRVASGPQSGGVRELPPLRRQGGSHARRGLGGERAGAGGTARVSDGGGSGGGRGRRRSMRVWSDKRLIL